MATCLWAKWGTGFIGAPYPLEAHLLDTVLAGEAVWEFWLPERLKHLLADGIGGGDPSSAKATVMLAAGLHDVGKANWLFQSQAGQVAVPESLYAFRETLNAMGLGDPSPSVPGLGGSSLFKSGAHRRHEYLSMLLLRHGRHAGSRQMLSEFRPVDLAVGGHHGRWLQPDGESREFADFLTSPESHESEWPRVQSEVISLINRAIHGSHGSVPFDTETNDAPSLVLLSGLVVLADWLASEEVVVDAGLDLITRGTPVDEAWLQLRREEIAAHVRDRLGSYRPPEDGLAAVLGSRSPRPVQKSAVADVGSRGGLWMVAYPTGEGKTEAALLRHIHGPTDEGLLFALPTRATTDAMFTRLERVFGDVVLSHGLASITQGHGFAGSGDSWWYTSSLRRLFAPVSAMTCDQILTGALAINHAPFRLLALASHHVVLDEVHTYDAYQTELLCELLMWWGATGTRVTLLSATLPAWQSQKFANAYRIGESSHTPHVGAAPTGDSVMSYPSHHLFSHGSSQGFTPGLAQIPTPISVTIGDSTKSPLRQHEAWVRQARETNPDSRIGVVVNTIDRCVDLAQTLTAEGDVVVVHSRMTAAHRSHVERDIVSRLGPGSDATGMTVVGTQVIEASLDIDFDMLSSDLAPAPSLVQRAGRLQRHLDPTRENRYTSGQRLLHVAVPTDEAWSRDCLPYADTELARVLAYLTESLPGLQLRVPDDIQDFVDACAFHPDTSTTDGISRELQDMISRLTEAQRATGKLKPLITQPTTTTTYRQLCDLTHGKDHPEEAPLRARFLDRDSATYVIVNTDPDRGSRWALPASQWNQMTHRLRDKQRLNATDARALVTHSLPVSERIHRALQAAHTATLTAAGLEVWEPGNATVAQVCPVSLTALADAGYTYDDTYGLIATPTGKDQQTP